MGRLANSRDNHISRWVLPVASRLLVDNAINGAKLIPLAKVAHIEMGQSPKGESYNGLGDGVLFIGGPADLGLVYPEPTRWTNAPTKLSEEDDIIICVRATIGEPRWADGVYCLGRGVAAIRPQSDQLDRQFLFRVIQSNESRLRELGTGTTFKTISKKHIASIKVPMISFEEQMQIGRYLDWLEKHEGTRPQFAKSPELPARLDLIHDQIQHIEALAARIEEARALRQSALEEAEATLSSSMREIFSSAASNADLVTLESVCEAIIDNLHSNPRYTENNDGIPCIRSPDVGWGKLFLRDAKRTDEAEYVHRTQRGEPQPNDIVFVREGGGTGKTAIIEEGQKLSLGQRVMMMRVKCGTVLPRFFLYQMLSPQIQEKQILPAILGSASPHLNIGSLRKFDFILPTIEDQTIIVEQIDHLFSRLDELTKLQDRTIKEIDALLPSVLDKAFNGVA